MNLIVDAFPKLRTLKNGVRSLCKESHFRGHFKKQHGKQAEPPFKSELQHLYDTHRSLWKKMSWENSLLVIWKILRLFVNTLTADEKDSVLNRDNLMEPIQMQLSRKQIIFFAVFSTIFEIYVKFQTFSKKKMTLVADIFTKIRTPKHVVR